MKYQAIKNQAQDKTSKLLEDCNVFWAFNNEQFAEGKAKNPLKKGEKYIDIGGGGYMPKGKFEQFETGLQDIEQWTKQTIKQAKTEEVILYELNNYESFYTGELDNAMEVLEPLGYTYEQVREVYNNNYSKVEV